MYFHVTGQMVYTVRQRCGQQLAIEAPTDADVVSTVPESATPAALGYAQVVSNERDVEHFIGSLGDITSLKICLAVVWPSVCGGSMQEPICGQNVHSTKHSPASAWSG